MMNDLTSDKFLDKLKKSIIDAGFTVMSDKEFDEWNKQSDAYLASPEGLASIEISNATVNYYLDNIARYKFIESMDEISGFGGYYEKTCRAMVDAGLQWFDSNPDSNPKFKGNKSVYGIILEDNDDAKALSNAVVKAAQGDCTGAMHQISISHILWIRKNGWQKYVERMSKQDDQKK